MTLKSHFNKKNKDIYLKTRNDPEMLYRKGQITKKDSDMNVKRYNKRQEKDNKILKQRMMFSNTFDYSKEELDFPEKSLDPSWSI